MLSTMRLSARALGRAPVNQMVRGQAASNRLFSTGTAELDKKIAKDGFFRTASVDTIKGPTQMGRSAKPATEGAETQAQPQHFMTGVPFYKWAPFMFVNPVTLAAYGLYYRNSTVEGTPYRDQVDSRNHTLAFREARRESLSAFKEKVWQREDPREHYDEATYRRNNYHTVIRQNSFGAGLNAHKNKVALEQAEKQGL